MFPSAMRLLTMLPRHVLMTLVRIYRLLSAGMPATCRFEQSCSAYALAALERHGAAGGTCLSVYRVLRCGPWCGGGHDPVPSRAPRAFRLFAGDLGPARPSTPSQTPTLPP